MEGVEEVGEEDTRLFFPQWVVLEHRTLCGREYNKNRDWETKMLPLTSTQPIVGGGQEYSVTAALLRVDNLVDQLFVPYLFLPLKKGKPLDICP